MQWDYESLVPFVFTGTGLGTAAVSSVLLRFALVLHDNVSVSVNTR